MQNGIQDAPAITWPLGLDHPTGPAGRSNRFSYHPLDVKKVGLAFGNFRSTSHMLYSLITSDHHALQSLAWGAVKMDHRPQ